MSHETPQQRRTRLIEQYVAVDLAHLQGPRNVVEMAVNLADAVIAATPQPEPAPTKTLDLKSLNYDGTPATRYPSEIETRLLELCELAIDCFPEGCQWRYKLTAIKRDLGLT